MRGKAGPHYKWRWPPPRQGHTRYKRVQAYDSNSVRDSMTKGLNSPDAKRPRGGRSPVPDDAEMPDKPQLRLPKERGALGRDSGGSGDRPSAPRAAPGRRITALSPESNACSVPSLLTNATRKKLAPSRTNAKRTTGPFPSPGMMALGGTPRTGELHPARGAGTDAFRVVHRGLWPTN